MNEEQKMQTFNDIIHDKSKACKFVDHDKAVEISGTFTSGELESLVWWISENSKNVIK